MGKVFLKVAVSLYYRLLINGKTPIKVTVCIYHHVFINGKDISRLRYVYVTMRTSKEKSFQSRGMCISLCINQRESRFKVAVCIHHRVFINRERRLKGAVWIYHRLVINRESRLKVACVYIIMYSSMGNCIYHHVLINGEKQRVV